ncbi:MAG TPA: hypothetical protein VIQ23_12740 [Hanamia sp.]|jgi:hypothetical protein
MKKFFLLFLIAGSFSCISNKGIVQTNGAQGFTPIDYPLAEALTHNFKTRYRQGVLKGKPEVYFIKFSKADFESLINSNPGVDSVNFVLASYSKKDPSDNKRYPTLVIQLYTPINEKGSKGGNDRESDAGYSYYLATSLCPPPYTGCRIVPPSGQ